MRYFIIAGEASGDLHGGNLLKNIRKKDEKAEFAFWGGEKMESAAGVPPLKHYKELAFMGFVEVILNLRTIFKNIVLCKSQITAFNPDVLVLIDYPGFNMRIAKFAKAQGIKVVYYISPQIWAWKQKRGYQLQKTVDRMLVILPFEKEFYKKFNMEVDFVGHPLIDAVDGYQVKEELPITTEKKIVAVLPGSRKQEIDTILPLVLPLSKKYPNFQFVIAGAPSQDEAYYQTFIDNYPVQLIMNRTYDLLSEAHAAIVTSGTATLEAALFKVPEVVVYKGSSVSYHIAKKIIKVPYISLVNLVMDQPVVKELIQNDVNTRSLEQELNLLLSDSHRNKMRTDFDLLEERLGGTGASARAANIVVEEAKV